MAKKRKNKKPLITCPICGQSMKRITRTHLAKHNMTQEEFKAKYGDLVATSNTSLVDISDPELLNKIQDKIVSHMLSDDQIDDISREVIQNLLKDQDGRFRVSLNIIAIKRLRELEDMADKLDIIKESLLDERRISQMSDANQIKLYQTVEKSIENSIDYIKSVSIDKDKKVQGLFEQTNIVQIYNRTEGAQPPQTASNREKVKTILSELLSTVTTDKIDTILNAPESEEVLDAEFQVIEQEEEEDESGSSEDS